MIDHIYGKLLRCGEDGEDAMPPQFLYDLPFIIVEPLGYRFYVNTLCSVGLGVMYLFEQGILKKDYADQVPCGQALPIWKLPFQLG